MTTSPISSSWLDYSDTGLPDKIRRNLGEIKIDGEILNDVEISDEMIWDSINDSLRLFSRYQPKRAFKKFSASRATKKLELGDFGHGILRVMPNGDVRETGNLIARGYGFRVPIQASDLDDYAEERMYYSMQKRELSIDFQWIRVGNDVLLDDVPSGTTSIVVEYGLPIEKLEDVPIDWIEWVENYATSLSKAKLGEIRSKFSGIPAAGGQISLNGQDLIQQSQQEIERLRRELVGRSPIEAPLNELGNS